MKCSTKTEAARIAFFGAKKMTEESGYEVALVQNPNPRGTVAYVKNPGGFEYAIIDAGEGKLTCDCGFYRENQEFGVCKHITRTRWEVAAQAEREAQQGLDGPDDLDAAIAQADQDEALAGQGVWTVHYLAGGTSPAFRM